MPYMDWNVYNYQLGTRENNFVELPFDMHHPHLLCIIKSGAGLTQ